MEIPNNKLLGKAADLDEKEKKSLRSKAGRIKATEKRIQPASYGRAIFQGTADAVPTAKRLGVSNRKITSQSMRSREIESQLATKSTAVPMKPMTNALAVSPGYADLDIEALLKEFRPMFLDNQYDASISFANLRIAPYQVKQLLDVKLEQNINEHGHFYCKGLLSGQQQARDAEKSTTGTNVVLSMVDQSGEQYTLFQGVVQNVEVKATQGIYYIEVHALSYSCLLDIQPCSRSFQNKKQTYGQLIEQVGAEYGAGVLDRASGGAATGKFIMQHRETDWQFLKRLASHFHTGLVCDIRYDHPMYYFGVPEVNTIDLDCFNYTVKKDLQKYKQLSANGVKELNENDFIYYEVYTDHVISIGDQVNFQGKQLYVAALISFVEDGIFINRCKLTPKKGLSQLYQPHDKVAGGSFNGQIMEIRNDQVKIHFDVDQSYDAATACFFPYSTIYSSQDGSGWYCMPEKGDTGRVYFPDGEEDHAYAISSVNEQVSTPPQAQAGTAANGSSSVGGQASGGGYSGQRDDPSVKSLRNSAGMEIRLTPDGIYIISDSATITLTEEGITMMSDNDITFNSKKNIIMSAEEDVTIVGTVEVGLSSESATVVMTDDVKIVGQEVKMN